MSQHPSREDLAAWLRGDELERFEHVEGCADCLDTLEELSHLDEMLVATFATITSPRPGFADRVVAAIVRRQREAEAWSVVADLFSLGWRTVDTVWDDHG